MARLEVERKFASNGNSHVGEMGGRVGNWPERKLA